VVLPELGRQPGQDGGREHGKHPTTNGPTSSRSFPLTR
jgi:hypothetical protein